VPLSAFVLVQSFVFVPFRLYFLRAFPFTSLVKLAVTVSILIDLAVPFLVVDGLIQIFVSVPVAALPVLVQIVLAVSLPAVNVLLQINLVLLLQAVNVVAQIVVTMSSSALDALVQMLSADTVGLVEAPGNVVVACSVVVSLSVVALVGVGLEIVDALV